MIIARQAILRVSSQPAFLAAAGNHDYDAAILERSARRIKAMKSKFMDVMNHQEQSTFFAYMRGTRQGRLELATIDDRLLPLLSEIIAFGKLYNRLCGEDDIEIFVTNEIYGRNVHMHDFPVLNCNFNNRGTRAPLGEDKEDFAGEGNFFYTKAGFLHNPDLVGRGESPAMMAALPHMERQ